MMAASSLSSGMLARLSSFQHYECNIVPASRLADAGFVFKNDEVACEFCDLKINDWNSVDDPVAKHRERSPQCPFIESKLHGNKKLRGSSGRPGDTPDRAGYISGRAGNGNTIDATDSGDDDSFEHFRSDHRNGSVDRSAPPVCNGNTFEPSLEEREEVKSPETSPVSSAPKEKPKSKIPLNLRRESERLRTFRQVDWNNLTESGLLAEEVAQAGLFYIGPGDKIQCAFCSGKLYNWSQSDKPYEEHAKHFPLCPFIVNPYEAGNVRIQDEVTDVTPESITGAAASIGPSEQYMLQFIREKPRHPTLSTTARRVASFKDGGYQGNAVQSDRALAKAGFTYLGPGDNVRCFFCAGGLRSWATSDVPWEEHARWFPTCFYVRACKGERYIQEIHERFSENGAEIASRLEQATGNEQSVLNMTHVDGHGIVTPGKPLPVDKWLSGTLARSFLDMGYLHEDLKRVYERRIKETGKDFPDEVMLLDALGVDVEAPLEGAVGGNLIPTDPSSFHSNSGGAEDTSRDTVQPKKNKRKKKKKKDKAKEPEIPPNELTPPAEDEILDPSHVTEHDHARELEKENEALRELRKCKICLDNDVNVVFLRCGHLVSCSECAPNLKNCPICREFIRGTVRTFMA